MTCVVAKVTYDIKYRNQRRIYQICSDKRVVVPARYNQNKVTYADTSYWKGLNLLPFFF